MIKAKDSVMNEVCFYSDALLRSCDLVLCARPSHLVLTLVWTVGNTPHIPVAYMYIHKNKMMNTIENII